MASPEEPVAVARDVVEALQDQMAADEEEMAPEEILDCNLAEGETSLVAVVHHKEIPSLVHLALAHLGRRAHLEVQNAGLVEEGIQMEEVENSGTGSGCDLEGLAESLEEAVGLVDQDRETAEPLELRQDVDHSEPVKSMYPVSNSELQCDDA
jgi:hypothetical protein